MAQKLPFTQAMILKALIETKPNYVSVQALKPLTRIHDGKILASNIRELKRKGYVDEGLAFRGFGYTITVAGEDALKKWSL